MRKIIKNAVCILLILTLSASTALLTYLHFFASGDRDISGEWTASPDMTGQASVMALSWLQDIEGVSVSPEDMELYMHDLAVQVNMTLEQTSRSEGTFHCHVVPESYENCRQAAYEAFARAFQELLAKRLQMAGYTGGTDQDAVEALVTETFGMSTVSYLMNYAPALLPSLEELQAQYDGSGTYETADDILTRRFESGGENAVRVESYIRKSSNLILLQEMETDSNGLAVDSYPVVFTLR